MELADIYLRTGQPARAEQEFREAIKVRPNDASAQFGLGVALAASGRPADAVAAFERSAQLAPKDPEPLRMLARVEAERKRFPQALAALDRAIKRAPASAALQMASGDTKGAIASAQAVARAHPDDAGVHGNLGHLLVAAGDKPGARKAYARSIQLSQNDAQILNNAAWLEVDEKGDLDKAAAWAKRATELQPRQASYHDTWGWVQRARGDLAGAEASLIQAAAIAPAGAATIHYHLGIVRSERGETAKAGQSFERALKDGLVAPYADDARQRLAALKK